MPFPPIAIVGRAVTLPGGIWSPEDLWNAVLNGEDKVGPAPSDRWGMAREAAIGGPPGAPDHVPGDKAWSDRGGYVTGLDARLDLEGLDLTAAGLDATTVRGLDTLLQLTLHTAGQALRDAGIAPGPAAATARAGLIMGNLSFPSAGMARFAERTWWGAALADQAGVPPTDPRDRFLSGLPALLARKALGLGGPAFALDAACASALYAIKLACDALADRRADLMVAGAVNSADDLFIHVGFCALQALSKTGQSRPFHAGADGLVPAEGAGFVVLKRLEDAVAAGDTIHGVIRGVGLSNDGRGRGLLVPAEDGQARAMASAWAEAGLDPATVGLLECHATGTPVGDAIELRSAGRVFAGAAAAQGGRLPIGSLKSNLGHLITAAGVAGLVKVLEAQKHGLRPPTLHVDTPNPALDDSPFRLLTAAEPWTGSRRAGVSAFGFGGNNAHLIVEPFDPAALPPVPAPPALAPVVVVALGARVGDAPSAAALAEAARGARPLQPAMPSIDLALKGLKFPPADMQQALGQQAAMLAAAREAAAAAETSEDGLNTGIFVGMGADPDVARYGARWRLATRAAAWGHPDDPAWLAAARDGVVPRLQSPGVLGTMPNIPANRVSSQLDLQGPGFTVSAEEASGFVALDIGARMVATGELDQAFVGAVDLSTEPVHLAALAALRPDAHPPGDAAVVLVLRREDEARAAGLPVLGRLCAPPPGLGPEPVCPLGGRSHAAHGLVNLAARLLVSPPGSTVHATVLDLAGDAWARALTVVDGGAPPPPADAPALALPARLPPVAVPAAAVAPAPAPLSPSPVPAPAPAPGAPLPLPSVDVPVVDPLTPDPRHTQTMAPAPVLPAVTALPAAPVARAVPQQPAAPVAPAPAQAPAPAGVLPPPSFTVDDATVGGRWAAHLHQLGAVHRQFLADQAALHQRFVALQQQRAGVALHLGMQRALGTALPAPQVIEHVPAPVAAPAPAAAAAPAPAPAAAPAGPGRRFRHTQKRQPTGLALSREQLLVHASGNISEIYGEQFRPQDAFHRQCRMPEPPLLLADRVVGLDATPGSMGLGTIWTETDITADAWYLHDGRIPAGVLIESGQADLMLISYLGIDLQHDGDRVYRLLGCTLTYHGDLPRVGETIRYDIHVDGHAKHGDVRLFFFHYDCFTTDENGENGLGRPILSVREGQAGFFTDAELAESAGVLWTPEEQEIVENPRLDAPVAVTDKRAFTAAEVAAVAEGRPWECFGPEWDAARPHVWTPRFQTERMLFLKEVTHFAPRGGPWKRGYLRIEVPIEADEWYFDGHFKNDPCMPGTLMFEGCLQAMAFYLTAMGVTLKRDGWRFQPTTDEPFDLKCRGQVDPGTKLLTYEIFVEEFHDGPVPTLYADLLCTSDGLKAFHARRVGLQLVPDWPMNRLPQMVERFPEVAPLLDPDFEDAGPVAEIDGFRFGYHSMVACAWGRPSHAFGPMYERYDGGAHVARLPGEPYHFMTRVTEIKGEIGSFRAGNTIEIAYDVPPDAWYFRENDCETMPFCVFLEAALQPCGWLACFVGSTLTSDAPLFFRNLDGTGTMLTEIVPTAGTFRTIVTLTNISRSGPMIIQSFDVQCLVGDTPVYALKTVFGFFPAEALANQVGLPCQDADFALLTEPCDINIDLKSRPERFFGGAPKLPQPRLCLVDRLTGWWPEGGSQGLGRLRGEKDVDPSEWYFKAHFYSDPVQPGSLGIEALIRLLQIGCMLKGMGEGMANPRFEPLRIGEEMSWKYRGQVIPSNKLVQSTLDIVEQGEDERGPYLVAEGSLWVDGKRIYEVKKMGMRVVDGTPEGPSSGGPPKAGSSRRHRTLDPEVDTWLGDHRPTFTVPSVPMMGVAELLAEAVPGTVTGLKDVRVTGWLTVEGPRRLRRETEAAVGGTKVRLYDDQSDTLLAEGTVLTGAFPAAPAPAAVSGTAPVADPYASGHLFHGPAFQLLRRLERGPGVAAGTLDPTPTAVPVGRLHPALLDAGTHLIPHDALAAWGADVPADKVAYPALLRSLRLYGPAPTTGAVTATARLVGMVGELVRLSIQWSTPDGLWAEAELLEMPFPKGPIGSAPAAARMAFLRDHRFSEEVRLSRDSDGETILEKADVKGSDWLPGTVAATYGSADPRSIALQEHLAHHSAGAGGGLHPRFLPAGLPLAGPAPTVIEDDLSVRVQGPVALDLGPVKDWWARWFGQTSWPTEDLYYGLIETFVRHVFLADPAAFAAVQGRPALFLANHQTAVESLVFSIVASALIGTPTVTVAKVEHQHTWLGHLIRQGFSWPGVEDPAVITYFDRDDKASLMGVIQELFVGLKGGTKSAMVHVEGTRSFDCTAPVQIMTGKFIDLALEAGVPIVPVRFTGGLPRAPLETRTEFPVGHGKQDLWLGRPILPEELAGMPYGERKKVVLQGINATGPSCADEQPLPGDPALSAEVERIVAATGASAEHATLRALLARNPAPCAATARLLAAVDEGRTDLGDDPEGAWLSTVARWFLPA